MATIFTVQREKPGLLECMFPDVKYNAVELQAGDLTQVVDVLKGEMSTSFGTYGDVYGQFHF